ncbi:MAG: hypothetical protein ACLFPS_08870 [Clostridia bacterium]
MRSANRAMQSGDSIEQAEENLKAIENQILMIQNELEKELEYIANEFGIMGKDLNKITISPTYSNITVHLVGLAWKPVIKY